MRIHGRKWTLAVMMIGFFWILAFLSGCEDNSVTGPDPTETPRPQQSPEATPTAAPSMTDIPSTTASPAPGKTSTPQSTPTPQRTSTPIPTNTPFPAGNYHGDTYWAQFGDRIGSIQFSVSPDRKVEGTIEMYAYCSNPLSEKYITKSFKTDERPEGGFYYKGIIGDVIVGWETWEIECSASGDTIEGVWSYFDNRETPKDFRGEGTWRAQRMP